MVGIYFSGTGNTKYCVEKFCSNYEPFSSIASIEQKNIIDIIKTNETIVFAYPIYFSNLPKIVHDFIEKHSDIWQGKKIFIIATMGLFSGDGTGCSARLFKKYGAKIIGGLHIKMPDCIGDSKLLKKSLNKNKALVTKATQLISNTVVNLKNNKPTKNGLSFIAYLAGLFGQRLWFYHETKNYISKLKINESECVGCSKCIEICPMNNLILKDNKAISLNRCTKCYRCISNCPQKAITLLGKNVIEQSKIENYL